MALSAQNFILVAAFVFLPLLLCEFVCRVYKSQPLSPNNFLLLEIQHSGRWLPGAFHARLGWIPAQQKNQKGNIRTTIIANGIRENGSHGYKVPPSVLAVGDSFTFGSQVSDEDTWPAQLEQRLGVPVVNAGVFGYGVDQSYLRAIDLIPVYQPQYLIFSFIPEDIYRAEHSIWNGASKPYFELRDRSLLLRNVPVKTPDVESFKPAGFRIILGQSYLAHHFFKRFWPTYWYEGTRSQWFHKKEHSDGVAITCRLFESLNSLTQSQPLKVILLIQYPKRTSKKYLKKIQELLSCSQSGSHTLLDLYPLLDEIKQSDAPLYESFFYGHMTAQGNSWVASLLANKIHHLKSTAPPKLVTAP